MIKVLELFAGIGACSKALERIGIEHEIVDAVEIDKYAVKSFNAVHGTNFEPQDITKWDKDIQVDLIMHGSPCQDFSVAGKQAGGDEGSGTRSSLMYETLRIVEKLQPKYVIWENVKNLLSKKHQHNYFAYIKAMNDLGYKSYGRVLNAKNYGVPQNRERVFTVSILGGGEFEFPDPIPLEKKLKDMLEENVDEKYYLSTNMKNYIVADNEKWTGNNDKALINKSIASTINTGEGSRRCDTSNYISDEVGEDFNLKKDCLYQKLEEKEISNTMNGVTNTTTSVQKDNYAAEPHHYSEESIKRIKNNIIEGEVVNTITANAMQSINHNNCALIKTANKQGYDIAKDGDGIDLAYPNSETRRGRVGHGVSKTLACDDTMGALDGYRIRKLTPKECWRLMGFDDSDFEKAEKVNSNTQLYKQAGNSIVVNVLEAIFRNLLEVK